MASNPKIVFCLLITADVLLVPNTPGCVNILGAYLRAILGRRSLPRAFARLNQPPEYGRIRQSGHYDHYWVKC